MIPIYDPNDTKNVVTMKTVSDQKKEKQVKDSLIDYAKKNTDFINQDKGPRVFNGKKFVEKKQGPSILDIMSLNRHQRRAIGKLNGRIKIPGIRG